MYSYYNSCFFYKKTAAIETTVKSDCMMVFRTLSHKRKKIDAYVFFFPFICSGIPGLALGILKMLIPVCFRDALQPADC